MLPNTNCLPALNLVTQVYANGLQGDSDFGGAFSDQFTTGRPSYSLGLQYELPVGNRLAKARLCRRKHELAQLRDQYSRALEAVKTEVDIAVRELTTSYQEIGAKRRALAAAEAEANTIEQRWKRIIDGDGSAALNLELLLRAQERVTEAERDYVNSLLTYNLSMINLKRSNGTLLQSESVDINKSCGEGCRQIDLSKGQAGGAVGCSQCTSGCSSCSAGESVYSNAVAVEGETYTEISAPTDFAPAVPATASLPQEYAPPLPREPYAVK